MSSRKENWEYIHFMENERHEIVSVLVDAQDLFPSLYRWFEHQPQTENRGLEGMWLTFPWQQGEIEMHAYSTHYGILTASSTATLTIQEFNPSILTPVNLVPGRIFVFDYGTQDLGLMQFSEVVLRVQKDVRRREFEELRGVVEKWMR
jgi:hypothetical protein